ncbi:hypothetical protein Y981_04650 [Leptospirillum ferriphilum YSK]|uniref:Uncharacterized protein n=1 Tax=Leptospirillum ferriphilum YSK TaxID=1441628 RepID=A0A059Y2A2_9BACT|nr:hypothetical protein Y981_04650 [Leptospirillum ferriphilum YSK]
MKIFLAKSEIFILSPFPSSHDDLDAAGDLAKTVSMIHRQRSDRSRQRERCLTGKVSGGKGSGEKDFIERRQNNRAKGRFLCLEAR